MYETFFGLNRRPFLATPDASCFVATDSNQEALDALIVCAESGQGIGILTADAGLGKTTICQRLVQELDGPFRTVYLGNCNFSARQALLQAILYELGHPYSRMPEDELRLELKTAVKSARPEKQGIVLVFDEAHLLEEGLLEEIRTLADFSEDAHPLIRVVLSGQLSLEERLINPDLDALNQRVRCHVTLPTLTQLESATYLAHRLRWASGEIDKIFTPEAVRLIAHSGDGNPRCLNQLADHSLLLAFVAEAHPVSEAIVRDALNDMRQLPLQMNEPSFEQPMANDVQHREETEFVTDFEHDQTDCENEQTNHGHESHSIETEATSSFPDEQESGFSQPEIESHASFGDDASFQESPPIDPQSIVSFEVGAECDSDPTTPTNELTESDPNKDRADTEAQDSSEHMIQIPSTIQNHSINGYDQFADIQMPDSADPIEELNHDRSEQAHHADSAVEIREQAQFEEEVVFDRYAALDNGQSVPDTEGIVWELTQRDDVTISTDASQVDVNRESASEEISEDTERHCDDLQHEIEEVAAHESENSQSRDFEESDDSIDDRELAFEPTSQNDHDSESDFNSEIESEGSSSRDAMPDVIIETIVPILESSANDWIYPDQQLASLEAVVAAGLSGNDELDRTESDILATSELVSNMVSESEDIEHQIGSDVLDMCLETQQTILDRLDEIELAEDEPPYEESQYVQEYDVIEPEHDEPVIQQEDSPARPFDTDDSEFRNSKDTSSRRSEALSSGPRPYGRLFSELRRRQGR